MQIETTNEFLYEETQRFLTNELTDEQELEDKIEYFTVQVMNLSAQRDVYKVKFYLLILINQGD